MTEALADIIHIRQCADGEACVRYNRGKAEVEGLPAGRAEALAGEFRNLSHQHYDWYVARAAAVHDRLAPDIGSANVLPCVQAVIAELRAG